MRLWRDHPWHPMLTHFPLALWTAGALLDAAALVQGGMLWWRLAYGALLVGAVTAAPALLTGFIDYLRVSGAAGAPPGAPGSPSGTGRATAPEGAQSAALQAATVHMVLMVAASGLFVMSLVLRPAAGAPLSPGLPVALSWLGLLALVAGGWFGGELVFRHGIGVKRESPGA
ncbi:MAG TPA: DUF2231 domain-containing protein [Bacillota bacterium]